MPDKYRNLPPVLRNVASSTKARGALKIAFNIWVELGKPSEPTENQIAKVRQELDYLLLRRAKRGKPQESEDVLGTRILKWEAKELENQD